jgi:hypothetical protein
MPVTVRELIVRATVVDTSNKDNQTGENSANMNEKERDQIISDCVDQVLQLLKNQKER